VSQYLSKDDFWAASEKLPAEEVTLVDPHGKTVGKMRMRGLDGNELEAYQDSLQARKQGERVSLRGAMTRLVAKCAINEDGSPYFDSVRELSRLGKSPSWMLMQLFDSATRLSGTTPDAVKEAAGNFDDDLSEPSPFD
jgi:hypothetical protein